MLCIGMDDLGLIEGPVTLWYAAWRCIWEALNIIVDTEFKPGISGICKHTLAYNLVVANA